jgi:hypothetical protein
MDLERDAPLRTYHGTGGGAFYLVAGRKKV